MADRVNSEIRRKVAYRKQQNRKRLFYQGAMLSVLAVLVALAFYVPQLIFQVQDSILCGNTVLGERESMDVEALSTTYEKSLSKRMLNFAEGQANGDVFFVTAQNLTPNEELTDYLYSDAGLYQTMITSLVDYGLMMDNIWYDDCSITEWKRYVIYSDDYAKGVNFILWYIQLETSLGTRFKFLVDAEDGMVYAMKTENSEEEQYVMDIDKYFARIGFLRSDVALMEIWSVLVTRYEALQKEEAFEMLSLMEAAGWTGIDGMVNGVSISAQWGMENEGPYSEETYMEEEHSMEEKHSNEEMYETILNGLVGYQRESDERVSFRLPYGKTYLEMVMEAMHWQDETGTLTYSYPDLMVGVRQIYELIPEFS